MAVVTEVVMAVVMEVAMAVVMVAVTVAMTDTGEVPTTRDYKKLQKHFKSFQAQLFYFIFI